MITFNFFETSINLSTSQLKNWLHRVALSENKTISHINYTFCKDSYLIDINRKFLSHDTLTDIITFDNCQGDFLNGDIFISVDRIHDNAISLNTDFDTELLRVIVHGLLHLCGYKDKTKQQSSLMRFKEEEKILLFHVEQS